MNDRDEQLESRLRHHPLPGLSDEASRRLLAALADDTELSPPPAGHSNKEIVMSQSQQASSSGAAPRGSGNNVVVAVCVVVLVAGSLVVFNRDERAPSDEKIVAIDRAASMSTASLDGAIASDQNRNPHPVNGWTGNPKTANSMRRPAVKSSASSPTFNLAPKKVIINATTWPRGGRIVGLSAPESMRVKLSRQPVTAGLIPSYSRPSRLRDIARYESTRQMQRSWNLGFRLSDAESRELSGQAQGMLGGDSLAFSRDGRSLGFGRVRKGLATGGDAGARFGDGGKAFLRGLKDEFGSADGDDADPNGAGGKATKKKQPAKPTVEEYTSKEVESVRKHFVKQFQQLAKANPKRELAIMRVKDRLDARLKGIGQQVAMAKRMGAPIAAVEGRVVVAEVVRAEVKGLDVDGDGRADFGNESYETIVENKFLTPLADPLSTLSIDVDTASFANTRRFLEQGLLPPKDAVRIEELVNYFNYDYTPPKSTSKDPFSVTLEMGACPWNTKHKLVMIGLKGRELPHDKRPAANLVFLIDVSGSMNSAKKLPLVKLALEMLVDQMQPKDRISIVTYSNSAKTVLEPTPGDDRVKILNAIHGLNASGGTNGAAGIQMAYAQAQKSFFKAKDGTNRVILCTDGDFNVGIKDPDKLVEFVRGKANKGVFLSIFGFGMGNYKGKRLETLSNKGNGNYGYIDGFNEAKKVFVEEMAGTLFTIAKDVKIQVEFNPSAVASYRLIGYENRLMAAQDFNNDKKDAGEIGAGHTVTALYEIIPATPKTKPSVDKLKYQRRVAPKKGEAKEVLTVKLRYKQPDADKSTKIEFPLKAKAAPKAGHPRVAGPSEDFEFAAAVAMYGLLLRDSKYAGNANLDLVRELAAGAMGKDKEGHRSDFLKLVHKTRTMVARKLGKPVPAPRAFEAGKINGKK